MTRASAQLPAAPRKPDSGGAATYDALRTATQWHRALFREPTVVWRYVDDDDGDDAAGQCDRSAVA